MENVLLGELAECGQQALELGRDLSAWLVEHGGHDEVLASLRRFLDRPDIPAALQLEPLVAALDAGSRHGTVRPRACHQLVGKLGALKRLALDLRGLSNADVHGLLDGRRGLLELQPVDDAPPAVESVASLATPGKATVGLVLIVEDDARWRKRLENKVRHAFPEARSESFSSHSSALARFEQLERDKPFLVKEPGGVSRQSILVLLDLGLPASDDDPEDDTRLGMELLRRARAYENLWRVVVVTRPRNYLEDHREATRQGVQVEDYIFKIDEAWESEIEQSLHRFTSRGISQIRLYCDDNVSRGNVRAGDVEFTMDGMPFLILKALAETRGQSASEEQLLAAIECESTGFSDNLLKLRQAFVEAFAAVGRHLSPADVLRTEDSQNDKPVYRLVPQAEIVDLGDLPSSPPLATRALVVDDDAGEAERTAGWLRRFGLEVRIARCGEEAVSIAIEQHPQILVLDLALPWRMHGTVQPDGGLQALDAIRGLPGLLGVRAIVVSAYADDDKVRRAGLLRGVRVDDWLHKSSELLESLLMRSCARLMAEIADGVVLSARARSPWVLEISRTKPWAALDGRSLGFNARSKGGWQFLKELAERPWLPVSVGELERALGLEPDDEKTLALLEKKKLAGPEQALRGRAKRLRQAAGEAPRSEDTFIKGIAGGYILRASVRWVE